MNREQRTQTNSATLNIEHLYRTFAKHIFKTIYKRKTVCQKANGNVVCEMCCDDSMQSESNKSISTPRHRLSPDGERGIGILKIELLCKWEKISGTIFTIKRADEKTAQPELTISNAKNLSKCIIGRRNFWLFSIMKIQWKFHRCRDFGALVSFLRRFLSWIVEMKTWWRLLLISHSFPLYSYFLSTVNRKFGRI